MIEQAIHTVWPDPAQPGIPLNPEQDGWHILCEPDEDGGEPLATFVLWWDGCGLWFGRKGDPLTECEPPHRAAEFHGYVGPLIPASPAISPAYRGLVRSCHNRLSV